MKEKPCMFGALLMGFLITTGPTHGQVLFSDNFESGNLDQWIGKLGLPHQGQIVTDPLRPTNHVLTFTGVNAAGDIFNASPISLAGLPQPLILSFDFLGLPLGGVPPSEYGGFAGVTTDPNGALPHYWL